MFMQELLYFVAAAEHLNFTSAANQVYITQSGLSKNISKMEQELGFQLFTRDKHNVELTPQGKAFLDSVNDFLMDCNNLKLIAAETSGLNSHATIGASIHYGHYAHRYIEEFLRMFPEEFENVNLDIACLPITELRQKLLDGEIDFLLATNAVIKDVPEIESVPLIRRRRVVILSQNHPLAGADKLKMSQLKDEAFAVINRMDTPSSFDMVITLCNCVGFYPKIVKRVPDFDTLYATLQWGQMVGVSCVEPDPSVCPQLKAIAIDEEELDNEFCADALGSDLYLAWRAGSEKPIVKQVREQIKQEFTM